MPSLGNYRGRVGLVLGLRSGLGLGLVWVWVRPAIAAIWAANDEINRLVLLFFLSSSMLNIGKFLSAV